MSGSWACIIYENIYLWKHDARTLFTFRLCLLKHNNCFDLSLYSVLIFLHFLSLFLSVISSSIAYTMADQILLLPTIYISVSLLLISFSSHSNFIIYLYIFFVSVIIFSFFLFSFATTDDMTTTLFSVLLSYFATIFCSWCLNASFLCYVCHCYLCITMYFYQYYYQVD